jgi:hypothetical protein
MTNVIKPLVSAVALLFGLGAMAMTLTIQQNPHAFTEPKLVPISAEPERLERTVQIPLVEMAMSVTTHLDTVIHVDEVRVEGRRLAAIVRPQPAREPQDKVVRAPCRDGEYRLLDLNRGVRLMCPGGSL